MGSQHVLPGRVLLIRKETSRVLLEEVLHDSEHARHADEETMLIDLIQVPECLAPSHAKLREVAARRDPRVSFHNECGQALIGGRLAHRTRPFQLAGVLAHLNGEVGERDDYCEPAYEITEIAKGLEHLPAV